MRERKQYEPEINVRDLLFHVLHHWRSCLICAVVGALLLGGYAYVKNLRSDAGRAIETVGETAQEQLAGSSSDYMMNNYLHAAESYTRILSGYDEYLRNSVLMRVDPNNKWVAVAIYYVKMDHPADTAYVESDVADALVIAYVEKIKEQMDNPELKAVFGTIDTRYIHEIVETIPSRMKENIVFSTNSNSMLPVQQNTHETATRSHTFTIRVTGTDEKMADEGLRCFEEFILNYTQGEGQDLGKHQLVRLSRYVAVESDVNLENRQVLINKNLDQYKSALNGVQKYLPGEMSRNSVLKFAVIGLLMGGLLAICFHVVQYVVENKIHDAREVSDAYGLPLYGEMYYSRVRRSGKGIDGLIDRWEFGRKKDRNETALKGISSLICDQYPGKRVLLTGTLSEEALCPFAEKLRKQVGDTAIDVQARFITNEEALRASSLADTVLIVEKKHVSRRTDIERMAEMLEISQAKVTGCIIL